MCLREEKKKFPPAEFLREKSVSCLSYSFDVDGVDKRLSRKMAISMGRPGLHRYFEPPYARPRSPLTPIGGVAWFQFWIPAASRELQRGKSAQYIVHYIRGHGEVGPLPIYPWWGCNNWLWGIPSGIGGWLCGPATCGHMVNY